jgi:CubicO group peptidase (beta-lactamase class C family)
MVRESPMAETPDNDWAVAAPDDAGLNAARLFELDKFLEQWPKHNIHAVLIARRGKLILERYFSGEDVRWVGSPVHFSPGDLHDIRSISKSVTSLLIGIARGEGKFPPLASPITGFFPEYAELRTAENGRITFEHLLTMSHGWRWDETKPWEDPGNNERLMLEAKDPYRYVMEQPMALAPGALFNYCGGATSLLGAALAKAVGRNIDVYANEKLFGPLGTKDFEWLAFTGSTEIAAFGGLRLRPRDLAKLGQLMIDDGRWNGKQILPPGWVEESTRPRMNTEGYGSLYYGYQWWLGRSLLGGHDLSWIAGFGNGGQRLFVVPKLDLVVAINAAHYGSPLQGLIPIAILNRLVMPAVNDIAGLPEERAGTG